VRIGFQDAMIEKLAGEVQTSEGIGDRAGLLARV
jgi:hypothetical protein